MIAPEPEVSLIIRVAPVNPVIALTVAPEMVRFDSRSVPSMEIVPAVFLMVLPEMVVPSITSPTSVARIVVPERVWTFAVVIFAVVDVSVVIATVVSVTAVATRVAIVAVPETLNDVNVVGIKEGGIRQQRSQSEQSCSCSSRFPASGLRRRQSVP